MNRLQRSVGKPFDIIDKYLQLLQIPIGANSVGNAKKNILSDLQLLETILEVRGGDNKATREVLRLERDTLSAKSPSDILSTILVELDSNNPDMPKILGVFENEIANTAKLIKIASQLSQLKKEVINAAVQNGGLSIDDLYIIGEMILTKALSITPILSGKLRKSAVLLRYDDSIVIAYLAPYALYIHENMSIVHPIHKLHNASGRFVGHYNCHGTAKFLEKAVQEFLPGIAFPETPYGGILAIRITTALLIETRGINV